MNKTIWLTLSFFCSGLLLSVPLSALEDAEPDLGGGYIEGPAWEEGNVSIPAYPSADDLLKVDVDNANRPYTFYVDEKNLSVSDSGVVRYSVVIESDSGARNVMFEGLNCAAGEYRTYAYGNSDGGFSEARSSHWERINDEGVMAHRINFKRYYMCDQLNQPYSVKEMLRRIRYPLDFNDGGPRSDW
ncbi:CNP1-like family protein [Sulfuriflexus mobilis]|uniref:CNP1-like family protein n=1 Tax=Sulfuriflexus mobilis TaxID=1811807 RepID=UPI000F84DF6C|nr:CNP1-like family protein [Sulfuriflexus mobilis]